MQLRVSVGNYVPVGEDQAPGIWSSSACLSNVSYIFSPFPTFGEILVSRIHHAHCPRPFCSDLRWKKCLTVFCFFWMDFSGLKFSEYMKTFIEILFFSFFFMYSLYIPIAVPPPSPPSHNTFFPFPLLLWAWWPYLGILPPHPPTLAHQVAAGLGPSCLMEVRQESWVRGTDSTVRF